MESDPGGFRAAAKHLLTDLSRTHSPLAQEELVLNAFRLLKIAAYEEQLIAARFHASQVGSGIHGLVSGLERALASLREEVT